MTALYNFTSEHNYYDYPNDKWDKYKGQNILPMWVADMDFACAPEISQALSKRLQHPLFGYSEPWPALNEAIVAAMQRDYQWQIASNAIVWLPGVVNGFNIACRMFPAGSGIITHSPVYPPFFSAPTNNQQQLQKVPMHYQNGEWQLDWCAFEAIVTETSKLFLLCNPHNPSGRVFSCEELQQVAGFAQKHELIVCSDEIHCGLILDEQARHIPFSSLTHANADKSITIMSPSKTWNIPALYCAFAIIPDKALRQRFIAAGRGFRPNPNVLGLVACEAAYRYGEPWRLALLEVLRINRQLLAAFITRHDSISMTLPQATYLAWTDCRNLGISNITEYFEQHGLGFSDGAAFGLPGFVRVNFACPTAQLERALERLNYALTR